MEVPVFPVSGGFLPSRFLLHKGLSTAFCEDCSVCCRFAGQSFSIPPPGSFGGGSERPTSRSDAGLPIRNIIGIFWRIRLFPIDPAEGCCRPLWECGKGGAVVFGRDAVRPDGAVGAADSGIIGFVPYSVPYLAPRFCPVPKNGRSRWGFPWGYAAAGCLSEQGRSPLRNAGRSRPATSETMDCPGWKDYIFLAFYIIQLIGYLLINYLYPLYLKAEFSNVCLSYKINLILYNGRRVPSGTGSGSGPSDEHVFYNLK